ncbi:MAG: DUF3566 domain-containing protein [Actinomycetota bacterium]|nr:DUF3566 domain-containing protein [Actinomycetota bacterium]
MSYGDEWRSAGRTRDSTTAVGWTDDRPGQRPPPGMTQAVQHHSQPVTRSGSSRRRAKLQVRRVDPWSVMKFSLVFSIVLCVVLVVAVAILYFLLSGMGVFDSVNATIGTFQVQTKPIFTAKGVIGVTTLVGLADIFLLTAIATLGAFAYNLCADLVGGIEVTLAEHE